MLNNEKAILRDEFRLIAEEFFARATETELGEIHARIAIQLAKHCRNYFTGGRTPPQRVAIYEPMRFELPVKGIIRSVDFLNNAELVYPEYDKENMWFVTEQTREKTEPDFIIVPGLFVDKSGNRLGRGKGYYDRYMKDAPLALERRVFLGYPFQFIEFVPAAARDVRVFTLPKI